MKLPFHVVLVGLPGSGKSTVGRILADLLDCGYVDFDLEIGRRYSLTIPQVFEKYGEYAFRKMEFELTQELLKTEPAVWSPGGGWVIAQGALALTAPHACIIHLEVSTQGALARLRNDDSIRPLIASSDQNASLERLWSERADAYSKANYSINTEGMGPEQVARHIISLIKNHKLPEFSES